MTKTKDIEAYIQEMKEISDRLAEGDMKLAEAVELYRQGAETAKKAEKILSDYEKEIEIISVDEGDMES